MQLHEQQLMIALQSFLWGTKPDLVLTTKAEWDVFWQLTQQQKVMPMAADALLPQLILADDTQNALKAIRETGIGLMAGQTVRTQTFLKIYQDLLEAGTRPLVVKGLICRSLYEKGELRASGDEDLLVSLDEFDAVCAILEECGMHKESGTEDAQVVSFFDWGIGLHLEVHRSLFSNESAAYGKWNQYFVDAGIVEENAFGQSVWTFSPTENMLYLFLHSFKHFFHSGFGVRQVCDICVFASVRGNEINWRELFRQLKEVNADVFSVNLLQIGLEYLGFSRYAVQLNKIMLEYNAVLDCNDLLEDLLVGGVYGSNSEMRKHSSRITLNALEEQKTSSSTRLLRTIFPSTAVLEGRYTYLQKCPYLLPVAWIQRIVKYAGHKGRGSAKKSVTLGEQRVVLLKKYKVIS